MTGIVEGLSCVSAGGFNQNFGASRMLFQIFCEVIDYTWLVNWLFSCVSLEKLLTLAIDDHPGIVFLPMGCDLLGSVFCVYRHVVQSVPK